MAQIRFHNYQRPVDSFDENRRLLGILQPGRIRGFDGIASFSGLGAVIGHSGTGIVQTNANNVAQTGPVGVWVAPIGTIVQETGNLASITFTTNAGNAAERIDAVYGEHQWLASIGGQAAVYGVAQGAAGGPVKPTVSNPKIQVILGYMHIPANATTLAAATWEPALVPMLGGADLITNHPELDTRYARLAFVNRFTMMNKWNQASNPGGVSSGNWTPHDSGNVVILAGLAPYTINRIADMGNGTSLIVWNPTNSGQAITLGLEVATAGSFLTIEAPTWGDLTGANALVIKENSGVMITQMGSKWIVTQYSDAITDYVKALANQVNAIQPVVNALVSVPVGTILEYDGSLANFNTSGLGTGPMVNWAICNGLNGTPDKRGRFTVGAISGVPNAGAPSLGAEVDPTATFDGINPPNYAAGNAGGKPHHKITVGELPAHHHQQQISQTDNIGTQIEGDNMDSGSSRAVYRGFNPTFGGAVQTADTGGAGAHTNLPPFIASYYIKRIA